MDQTLVHATPTVTCDGHTRYSHVGHGSQSHPIKIDVTRQLNVTAHWQEAGAAGHPQYTHTPAGGGVQKTEFTGAGVARWCAARLCL